MSAPTEYTVVLAVQAALQGIKTTDGYFSTVESAVVKLDPEVEVENLTIETGARPCILIQAIEDRREYVEAADHVRVTLPFLIHWIDEVDLTDDTSRMRKFFNACADIERAIVANRAPNGSAIPDSVRIASRREWQGDQPAASQLWVIVAIELWFHRVFGQA